MIIIVNIWSTLITWIIAFSTENEVTSCSRSHKALKGICPEVHYFTERWWCFTAHSAVTIETRFEQGGRQDMRMLVPFDCLGGCVHSGVSRRQQKSDMKVQLLPWRSAFVHTFYVFIACPGPHGGCLHSTLDKSPAEAALTETANHRKLDNWDRSGTEVSRTAETSW